MIRRFLLAAAIALLVRPRLRKTRCLPLPTGAKRRDAARAVGQDLHRYRVIFEDERGGDFAGARAEIARLGDTSLMGYILAEHYLSPHSRRTPLVDLNDWLRQYGDLSIADRVYKLAHRRAQPQKETT